MILRFLSPDEYYAAFPRQREVFASRAFHELNAERAERVVFAMGSDDGIHPRLGLVLGLRDGCWRAPYSAPFASVDYNKPQALEHVYDFFSELAHALEPTPLQITLPPPIYDPEMLPKAFGVLANMRAHAYYDYNYHYPLSRFDSFTTHLDPAFRNHFNRASHEGFTFERTDDLGRVYSVIAANRASKGYPLAMSEEQLRRTIEIIPADLFLLSCPDGDAAAAVVYHTAPDIAQVIYWGDAPGFAERRPMNILPFHVLGYYRSTGFSAVDIGPASSNGIPNTGLCRYKESFGCLCTLKPTFKL